jgi:hypothetical protein
MPMRRCSGGSVLPCAADHLATEADLAGADRLQPGHGAQQGGLAAAGRADQHADVAGPQAERHVVHRRPRCGRVLHIELASFQVHAAAL